MCYLVREHQAGASEPGGAVLPPSRGPLRPRSIGAVVAVLMAGVAVAALVAPPATSLRADTKDAAPVIPLASKTAILPTATGVEKSSLPVDDGVPSPSDVAKAGAGECHHGL